MKTLPADALAAIQSGQVVIAGAARFAFGTTYRLWSGFGTVTINAESYTGVGARSLITPISSSVGSGVEAVELQLSNLDADIAATIEAEDYHQKPVTIYRLIFDAAGTSLLVASLFYVGRVDVVRIVESGGGDASILMTIEGAGRDMDRAGVRLRSDTDQRVLGASTDGGMKHISVAGQRTLSWGQKPQAAPIAGAGAAVAPSVAGFPVSPS